MRTERARPRVLITRPAGQSSVLAEQVEARGMEAVVVPAIALAPPASYAALDAAVAELGQFGWVLFTSANAVRVFAERGGGAAVGHGGARMAAIGPATERALAEAGLAADLVPPVAVAESMAEALEPEAGTGARMLLVRAEAARDVLPERLRAAGAALTVAPAYRNVVPEASIPLLQRMFREAAAWPEAITFTSASTVTNLLALLEAAGLKLPVDGEQGRTVVRASIGPITSATLREVGWAPQVEARDASVVSLAEALAERLLG